MDKKLKRFTPAANTQAAEQPLNVTLPTATQLNENNFSYEPTDFALFSGARTISQCYDKSGGKHYYTEVWTSKMASKTQMRTCTVDNVVHRFMVKKRQDPRIGSIAVAPRFQNPAELGLEALRLDGHDYLTLNGQMFAFPGTQVDPNTAQILNQALQQRACCPLNNYARQQYMAGNYVANSANAMYYRQYQQQCQQQYPINYNYQDVNRNYFYYNCYTNNYAYYQYQGQCYALYTYPSHDRQHVVYDWFNLEPVQVVRNDDGSLQCLHPIFAASYMAVNNLPGGTFTVSLKQYLNRGFMQQLMESLAFSQVTAKQYAAKMNQQQAKQVPQLQWPQPEMGR